MCSAVLLACLRQLSFSTFGRFRDFKGSVQDYTGKSVNLSQVHKAASSARGPWLLAPFVRVGRECCVPRRRVYAFFPTFIFGNSGSPLGSGKLSAVEEGYYQQCKPDKVTFRGEGGACRSLHDDSR